MSRYRTWPASKWNREPFRSLSPELRYVYLTIVLGPYTVPLPGTSVCGPKALEEAVGSSPDFPRVITELQERAGLLVDFAARIFTLPDVIAEAAPANPNQVRAWRSAFDELIESEIKAEIDRMIQKVLLAWGRRKPVRSPVGPDPLGYLHAWQPDLENVGETFDGGPSTASGALCQRLTDVAATFAEPVTGSEPVPEEITEPVPLPPDGRGATVPPRATVQMIFDLWNDLTRDPIPPVRKMTAKRHRLLQTRLSEHPDINEWANAIKTLNRDDFKRGANNIGWTAGFDYLLRDGILVELIEASEVDPEIKARLNARCNRTRSGQLNRFGHPI